MFAKVIEVSYDEYFGDYDDLVYYTIPNSVSVTQSPLRTC